MEIPPGVARAEALQTAIDQYLAEHEGDLPAITLGRGSEVTNLERNVDVDVWTGSMSRSFTIVTADFISTLRLHRFRPDHPRPEDSDIYVTGGPLLIVARIDGSSVVRAVALYLQMEARR